MLYLYFEKEEGGEDIHLFTAIDLSFILELRADVTGEATLPSGTEGRKQGDDGKFTVVNHTNCDE